MIYVYILVSILLVRITMQAASDNGKFAGS